MKISKQDLYWGLSHQDEKIYKPVFEYWVRQWLCHPAPATKEQVLAWQNNKRLLKRISAKKIEQRGKDAILAVIANVPQLNYDRINSVLDVICIQEGDEEKKFRVNFLAAVISRLFDDQNVCYFGIEWRLRVCAILLEKINAEDKTQQEDFLNGLKKLAKTTQIHGLSKQYKPLLKKFIKKFPQYKTQVLEVIDIILNSYAKTFELQEDSDDWAIYNISKYCSEAVNLIKYGLQLALSKDIEADRRWKYTHIILEMILYCPTINPDDYAKKINKMLNNRWCYDHCARQMIQVLTVYVKIGKEDMTNRMLYVKSLIFPIIDKMLNFYPLTGDNTAAVAEFCKLYMPLQPDYWQKCQACVEENLKKESDRQQKELEREAFRINRILTAISE